MKKERTSHDRIIAAPVGGVVGSDRMTSAELGEHLLGSRWTWTSVLTLLLSDSVNLNNLFCSSKSQFLDLNKREE